MHGSSSSGSCKQPRTRPTHLVGDGSACAAPSQHTSSVSLARTFRDVPASASHNLPIIVPNSLSFIVMVCVIAIALALALAIALAKR